MRDVVVFRGVLCDEVGEGNEERGGNRRKGNWFTPAGERVRLAIAFDTVDPWMVT